MKQHDNSEALRLAVLMDAMDYGDTRKAAALLRQQSERIAELEAEVLEQAVNAGRKQGLREAADEIERLLDSREREGDRLDWLLARLPGSVIRDLVGVMSDTRDAGEWRDLIDQAACFAPYNPPAMPRRHARSQGENMKPYTVLLLRPDYIAEPYGQDTYLAHVEAESPANAIETARIEVWKEDHGDDAGESWTDYHPLFITEGHHQDMS